MIQKYQQLCMFLFIFINKTHEYTESHDTNRKYNFMQLSSLHGYEAEQYEVVTDDSYVLTLFRIRGRHPKPTLLIHGFVDSADTWVIRGNLSLGIQLANLGYDLWFVNCRGNTYSRKHLYYNPDKIHFWDFSFHEIGFYDLPAIIDKVLKVTGSQNLDVIGHSQGSLAVYILTSCKPNYNKKIRFMIALAPIFYLHNTRPLISYVLKNHPLLSDTLLLLNIYELFGYNTTIDKLFREICMLPKIGYDICIPGFFFHIIGFDSANLDQFFLKDLLTYFPAGSSTKNLAHFEQIATRRKVSQYDYGMKMNLNVYHAPTPPEYNLTNVEIPVVLISVKNDYLSTLADVEILKEKLPNVVRHIVIPKRQLNHVAFTWAKNAVTNIHPYIIHALRDFE